MSRFHMALTLILLLPFFSCSEKKQKGIEGNNNSSNTVVMGEGNNVNVKNETLNKYEIIDNNKSNFASENIINSLSLNHSLEFLIERFGEPKYRFPHESKVLEMKIWEFENLRICVVVKNDKIVNLIYVNEINKTSKFTFPECFPNGINLKLGSTKFRELFSLSDISDGKFISAYRDNVHYILGLYLGNRCNMENYFVSSTDCVFLTSNFEYDSNNKYMIDLTLKAIDPDKITEINNSVVDIFGVGYMDKGTENWIFDMLFFHRYYYYKHIEGN